VAASGNFGDLWTPRGVTPSAPGLTPETMFGLLVALCVGISSFVFLPIGGVISDRVGRWQPAMAVPLLAMATVYPAMAWLVAAPSFAGLLLFGLWVSFLYAMFAGTLVPLIADIMPAKVRASGFAIIISLANGIFGSFTPAIGTLLIKLTGNSAAPALWLSAAAAISFVAAVGLRRFAPRLSLQQALS
jgi:MHS family citrate/tricarballylate:H+ symporter-like MFS transporter